MGDVIGGLFGDEPDYVGDNLAAQRQALTDAMEQGRILADSQYARNKQAAYDTAALNRYNQITPYGSLTWYNTNDPQEAKRLAEADRLNSFTNKLWEQTNKMGDYNQVVNAANQFLNGSPTEQRAAMNLINRGQLDQYAQAVQANQAIMDAYNQDFQAQKAAYQQAMQNYQQPNGVVGLGTTQKFPDPTLQQQ